MSGDILGCCNWEGGVTGTQWVEPRYAAQDSAHDEVQNGRSASAEQTWWMSRVNEEAALAKGDPEVTGRREAEELMRPGPHSAWGLLRCSASGRLRKLCGALNQGQFHCPG